MTAACGIHLPRNTNSNNSQKCWITIPISNSLVRLMIWNTHQNNRCGKRLHVTALHARLSVVNSITIVLFSKPEKTSIMQTYSSPTMIWCWLICQQETVFCPKWKTLSLSLMRRIILTEKLCLIFRYRAVLNTSKPRLEKP